MDIPSRLPYRARLAGEERYDQARCAGLRRRHPAGCGCTVLKSLALHLSPSLLFNHISSFFSHPLITLAPNMFMPSRLPFLAASLLSLAGSLAAPIDDLAKRIVISPEITSPTAETVWKAGSTVTVTWSTELLEEYPEAQNYTGTIYLGKTLIHVPLWNDFSLTRRCVLLPLQALPKMAV